MLKDGTLDSATWQSVRPYYDQPVNVPQGEIKILWGMFPGYINSIPAAEDLPGYEPWSQSSINRFFDDYPDLLNIKPILSFETSGNTCKAGAGFSFNDYTDTNPMFATRFSCDLYRTITAAGRAQFSDNSARWNRRSASIKTPENGKLTIGNFDINIDRGLMFGRFPDCDIDSACAFNWLYASANSWNGAMYEYTGHDNINGSAFFHNRPAETMYGVKGSAEAAGNLRIIAGITRATISKNAPESFTCMHAGLTYISKNWDAGILAGADPDNRHAIPFVLHIIQSNNKAGINASYAYIPGGCNTGFSPLRKTWSRKLSDNDSLKGNANIASMQCRMPLTAHLLSACGLSYYCATGMWAMENFLSLTGAGPIDYNVKYTYRQTAISGKNHHNLSVSASRRLSGFLQCSINGRYVNSRDTCRSYYGRFMINTYPYKGIEIAPFVSTYGNFTNKSEVCIGLSQSMRLFEKTWSKLRLEAPVIKNFSDKWEINAELYFLM